MSGYYLEDIQAKFNQLSNPIALYQQPLELVNTFSQFELLKYNLQNNKPVIFINTFETYGHYHHIALKSGIKLDSNKLLLFIDLFSKNVAYQNEQLPLTELYSKLWIDSNEENYYEDTLNLSDFVISKVTTFLKDKQGISPIFIIDDLFTLNLIIQERNTIKTFEFLNQLRQIQQQNNSQLHIFSPILTNQNEEFDVISSFLFKHAQLNVQFSKNSSGFSKDIDGQVYIRFQNDPVKKSIYQLNGNDIKLLSALQIK